MHPIALGLVHLIIPKIKPITHPARGWRARKRSVFERVLTVPLPDCCDNAPGKRIFTGALSTPEHF